MSRIGNAPITVPAGVAVSIDGTTVTVNGAKGSLTRTFTDGISFRQADGVLTVARSDDARESRALHGLSRALLRQHGGRGLGRFQPRAEHGRRRLSCLAPGEGIELLVGFSHPVKIEATDGITFEVPEPTRIVITGHRQGAGRPGGRQDPPDPPAGALQGQGHSLLGRE